MKTLGFGRLLGLLSLSAMLGCGGEGVGAESQEVSETDEAVLTDCTVYARKPFLSGVSDIEVMGRLSCGHPHDFQGQVCLEEWVNGHWVSAYCNHVGGLVSIKLQWIGAVLECRGWAFHKYRTFTSFRNTDNNAEESDVSDAVVEMCSL